MNTIGHAMIELLTLLKSDEMDRSLHILLQLKHFLWLVLDTCLIFVSHVQLDIGKVIEEAKQVH